MRINAYTHLGTIHPTDHYQPISPKLSLSHFLELRILFSTNLQEPLIQRSKPIVAIPWPHSLAIRVVHVESVEHTLEAHKVYSLEVQ